MNEAARGMLCKIRDDMTEGITEAMSDRRIQIDPEPVMAYALVLIALELSWLNDMGGRKR